MRLARPFEIGPVVEALMGIPTKTISQMADAEIATGPDASRLLDAMPHLLRCLRMSSNRHMERSSAGLRGPVLWAETVAARSASFGQADVYVCSVPSRDYDVPENRLLVSALRSIALAGDRLTRDPASEGPDEVTRLARTNMEKAFRYMEHRTLAQVSPLDRPVRAVVKSVLTGRSAAAYRPAVDQILRSAEPLDAADLSAFCGRHTRTHHAAILALIDAIESSGRRLPALRAENRSLLVGSFEYRHPRCGRTGSKHVGMLLSDDVALLLTDRANRVGDSVAELVGSRRTAVIRRPTDLTAALAGLV